MFKFIDLFAGIGGFRFAFEDAGGECVFSSEYDKFAQVTYEAFFEELPDCSQIKAVDPPGDITKVPASRIPDHDILVAGFPCQPFSLAGVSKKESMGSPHGFHDPTQGTLFFDIKRIIAAKRPSAFLLENVKNLKSHDKGRTFELISKILTEKLGYDIHPLVIDAAGWVPQHRERIYIVGFHRRRDFKKADFETASFWDEAEIAPPAEGPIKTLDEIIEADVPEKYTLGPGTWRTLQRHRKYHEQRGNGFGYGMIEKPFKGKVTRTISARYHKDGAEVLIAQPSKSRPRRLTPLECYRLMGFPEKNEHLFRHDVETDYLVSDTQAYRQLGNSVVVPLVTDIANAIVSKMKKGGVI